MTLEEAKAHLGDNDGSLGWYISWSPGDKTVTLEAEDLLAIMSSGETK